MTRPQGLSSWYQAVSTHLPHLSAPQRTVLVLWSVGIVLAQSCGLATVATVLAYLLGCAETTLREQLRDWYRDAPHKSGAKRGRKRQSLDVTTCFAPLLRWVVAWWEPSCRQLALVLDASTLGQRFTILTISVVVRGCAIPVAWHIVEARRPGAWRPHWLALLIHLDGAIPADWLVIVLADRGLYAKWLFEAICARGWHPFLRINRQGQYCAERQSDFRPLSTVITEVGQVWAGTVRCFKTAERQLSCTLLGRWDRGYKEPWLVLTDLPPATADVAWYALRSWIECGFKAAKRGGWHWEQTKMRDPRRAERLWLAMAVATVWTVSVGCQAEAVLPAGLLADLPPTHIARRKQPSHSRPRTLSCFRRGRLVLIAALVAGQELPQGRFLPEPWPKSLDTQFLPPAVYRPRSNAA